MAELPAGPLSFATGVVYRKEKGWRDPDPLTVLGIANTNQQDPISGTSIAKEAYLELAAPVLENLPLVPSLSLTSSARTGRSEERRVGKECGGTCRSRWSPLH